MSMDAGSPVREFIPEARISTARIRAMLARECTLGRWSCGSSEAIRPMRLAALLRRCIWQAHDLPLAAVRKRLARAGRGDEVVFEVTVDVDIGAETPQQVMSLTCFSRTRSGRIAARIDMRVEGLRAPITSRILLPAPG